MTAVPTTTARPEYMLGDSQAERRRLIAQAALMEDEAGWLLQRLDIPVGGRAVDIGCGPVGILPQLSARVGPNGEVVGLDRHADMLDHAARTCAELPNVRFELGDAVATELPRRSFDVAHIRLVLVNVPDPVAVLREASSIVRPGGTVAVQEVDWLSWQCEPAHPAWTRLRTILTGLWHSRNLDPFIGRRLPAMLDSVGLVDVQAMSHAGIDSVDDWYHRLMISFAGMFRGRIIDTGLADADELDALIADLGEHLATPGTVVVRALTVQAWGRVPG
jgi:SAM-dependent methyltransferase